MRFAGSPKVANFLSSSPDYGLTGQQGLATNTELRANELMNEAKLQYQEEKAEADIEAAKYGAQARADIAGANSEVGMIGGIAGAATDLIGGIGQKLRGSRTPSYRGGSSFGIPSTRDFGGMSAPSVPFGSVNLGASSAPPVNLGGGFGFGGGGGGSLDFSSNFGAGINFSS